MSEGATAYPLAWPAGYPRTPSGQRLISKFTEHGKPLTVDGASFRLQRELDRLRAKYVVLSTNLELRLNGLPRAGQPAPQDPGAACYFLLKGRAIVLPCDCFTAVAGNIAAIAAHIEATRAIERYGVGTMEQMFTGFMAIRGPGPKPWREVLGFAVGAAITRETIEAKRRELARKAHPDVGGSDAQMAEINAAADRALEEIGA